MFCFSIPFTQSAVASPHLLFFPPTPTPTPTGISIPTTLKPRSSPASRPCRCTNVDLTNQHEETPRDAYPKQDQSPPPPPEEETFHVLTAIKTVYNDIVIVDTADSRMLLLDSTRTLPFFLSLKHLSTTRYYYDSFPNPNADSIHSILQKGGEKWTGSYWGGGTAAHLMLDAWPSLQLEGWEIDEILIDKAREYFGLSNLERCNEVGGGLQVHIGDVFSPEQHLPSGYAGIIVDLFSDGKVLSQLQEVKTWLELSNRLMPYGRLMVNCGGVSESSIDGKVNHQSVDEIWILNSTIKALAEAFPGQVNWKRMPESQGQNYLALTGPLPDVTSWSAMVPTSLSEAVKQWKPCKPFH
ncbi:hypothetical protein V6N13_129945 [Hibiscus sabdariffa]